MHFSKMNDNGGGSKATKIAVVAVFHVLVATALIHSMNTKVLKMPKLEEIVMVLTPEAPPPPPPPVEPPKPMPKAAPPTEVFQPPPEVAVQPTEAPVIATTSVPDPLPMTPAAPAEAAAAPASPDSGAMRTAVLADGNSCAKPDYPVRAARNGETGTVSLALLVGADGKVSGSRIQKSSGSRELDRAAITALSLCTFKPATKGGVAEPAWGQIAYVWTLDQ